MFTPTLSYSGSCRSKRIAGLAALLLSSSTGMVMAANPGCQVPMRWEALRAQKVVLHKVHHSEATLARWKVGAEAWSKAHHGKVYAGNQPPPVAMVWNPLRYSCNDIALDTAADGPLLIGEAPPVFEASALPPDTVTGLDIASAQNAPTGNGFLLPIYGVPVYGAPIAGTGPVSSPGGPGAPVNGPVGPSSFPPLGPEPTPRHLRLLPPKHPPLEVTLMPTPVPPPTIVPTPEPSAVILLGTGLGALGLGRVRRWFTA